MTIQNLETTAAHVTLSNLHFHTQKRFGAMSGKVTSQSIRACFNERSKSSTINTVQQPKSSTRAP